MRRGALSQMGLLALALAFIAIAIVRNWDSFVAAVQVDPVGLAVAIALCLVGLTLLGLAWATIHPPGAPRAVLVRRFLLAQPGKYIPGGVAMPLGQVVLSKEHDTSASASIGRLIAHSAMMVAGALLVAGLMIANEGQRWLGLVCLAAGVACSGLLVSANVDGFLSSAGRMIGAISRGRFAGSIPPLGISRWRMAGGLALAGSGIASMSSAFPILSGGVETMSGVLTLVGAFAFAWTVGFVAIPIPAGAGVREAALVFALSGVADSGSILAVGILHRLAMLAAEAIGFLGGGWMEGSSLTGPRSSDQ